MQYYHSIDIRVSLVLRANTFVYNQYLTLSPINKSRSLLIIQTVKSLFDNLTLVVYSMASSLKTFTLGNLSKVLNKVLTKSSRVWSKFKYYYLGLGYKVYTRSNVLFVWLGLTHYTLIDFPLSTYIFAKKRRMYIMSTHENSVKELLASIKRAKKRDIYKGKGLLEVKSYKNFIKMKTGKKKQY